MKIITAMNNPNLNIKLNKEKNIDVVCKDIQYKDAIIDILENNKKIDIIIINENIPGEITDDRLIKKIKEINNKIRIIYLIEKMNKKINSVLEKNKIKDIYLNNEMDINKIKNIIYKNNNNQKMEYKINNYINKKIITVSGPPNVGKTNFIINFFKIIKNKKILLIDFDLNKQNIFYFLGIKKYSKKINRKKIDYYFNNIEDLVKDFLIKINKRIFLISGLDLFTNLFNKKDDRNLDIFFQNLFNQIKNEYDLILIDIGSDNNSKINNNIYLNSDLNIFLIEANLIGMNKFKNYMEKINNTKNINIIVNKKDKYYIDNTILKRTINHKIIGEIKYKNIYSNLINNKFNYYDYLEKIFKKEYYDIYKKIYK